METVKVYQIGLGSFGRNGFEKLVELHRHFGKVDVQLKGVCDTDFERLDDAEKFAEAHDIFVETFQDVEELYKAAEQEKGRIMIYDAGPSETHSRHIHRSLQNNFFHLAEKPPSMSREEHLSEKEMSRNRNVMYKVDFIERESPVVRKATEVLEDKEIDRIDVFRQSSIGLQKLLEPVKRAGVKGGAVLDKMVHEAYVFDLLGTDELEYESVETDYFMPKTFQSDKFMSIRGGYTENIGKNTAQGMVKALLSSSGTDITLHGSWLGFSEDARKAAAKIKQNTGFDVLNDEYLTVDDKAFLNEECRFFTVQGERNLAGDMLNGKLFDLETGEEIETSNLLHDQLFRVIEKAVLNAAGRRSDEIGPHEVDEFMNALFDVQEEASGDAYDELEKTRERLKEMLVEDRKILEPEESDTIAG
ncbi:MAG: Gfo/Idh/MocA family oxidoreductase [Candidatus Nanohalobium sp.]